MSNREKSSITEQQCIELAEIAVRLMNISEGISNSAERRAIEVMAKWTACVANSDLFDAIDSGKMEEISDNFA